MRSNRSGFSLVELIMAVSLTLVVFAITLPFVRVQTRALGENAGRVDAEQIARFAQRVIDNDLRVASADPGQSILVHAGTHGISFNANLLAADTLDPNALGVETGAASTLTEAWRVADAAVLPLTARAYPTEDYTDASGALSRIETISYFLHPDTVSGRSDIYVLYRRVNARDSVQLVRGIHVPTDSAFFRYYRLVSGTPTAIAASSLPLYWDSTMTAEIQSVQTRSAGYFRNRQTGEEVIRNVYWVTTIENSVETSTTSCGTAPAAPTLTPNPSVQTTGGYHVRVTWNKSTDDVAGGAVTHYQVATRPNTTPIVWTPIGIVTARAAASYRFEHYLPALTGSVKYGVTAVDCGGAASTTASHTSNLGLP